MSDKAKERFVILFEAEHACLLCKHAAYLSYLFIRHVPREYIPMPVLFCMAFHELEDIIMDHGYFIDEMLGHNLYVKVPGVKRNTGSIPHYPSVFGQVQTFLEHHSVYYFRLRSLIYAYTDG
jgi:hypothetical protein